MNLKKPKHACQTDETSLTCKHRINAAVIGYLLSQ